jgi:hypothetical protein
VRMTTVLQRGNRKVIIGSVAASLSVVAFLAVSFAGSVPASASGSIPIATLTSGKLSCSAYATGPFLTSGAGSKVEFGGNLYCNQVRSLTMQATLYYDEDGTLIQVAGEPKIYGTDTNIGNTWVHTCEGTASTTYVIQLTNTSDVGIFNPNPSYSSTSTLKCTPF